MNTNLYNNRDQTITTAPYNTLNLPEGIGPNLSNPQINSNFQYQVPNLDQKPNYNPYSFENTDSNVFSTYNIPLGSETTYNDPTKQMVNDYLKTNKSMYDNRGKYFDSYLFNQKFDEYIKQKTAERKLKEQVQLYDLDSIDNIQVQPYQLPLNKLLINFKNIWFKLFDDLLNGKNPSDLFVVDNFFYFGMSCIVFFLLYIMLAYIFE